MAGDYTCHSVSCTPRGDSRGGAASALALLVRARLTAEAGDGEATERLLVEALAGALVACGAAAEAPSDDRAHPVAPPEAWSLPAHPRSSGGNLR